MSGYLTSLKITNAWGDITQEIPFIDATSARKLEFLRNPVGVEYELASLGLGLVPLHAANTEEHEFIKVLYGSNGKGKTTALESIKSSLDILNLWRQMNYGEVRSINKNLIIENLIQNEERWEKWRMATFTEDFRHLEHPEITIDDSWKPKYFNSILDGWNFIIKKT